MKLGLLDGRPVILHGETVVDVATASEGLFGTGITDVYERWSEFCSWYADTDLDGRGISTDVAAFDNPVPEPRQVFAIGLNYAAHAAESTYDVPDLPPVFTKFRTSLRGPRTQVVLPGDTVDWEVELVVVIGIGGAHLQETEAWAHVAGLTVGQDISERTIQFSGTPPQFSLGKSYPGFAPIGPVVVTPDEFPDRNDLTLVCEVNGEIVQKGRTSELIFPVSRLVSHISAITPLLPGDLIFTGTPSGIGHRRSPPRYLQSGDVLRSCISGIGEIEQTFVARDGTGNQ